MLALSLVVSPLIFGWGDEGHRAVNRVAVEKLPEDMPQFFKNAGARLMFLGPEPDRWGDSMESYTALRGGSGPEHFIDIETPESFQAIPDDRYKYADWLRARGQDVKDVGLLPYAMLEYYQRVQVLFRLWRDPQREAERDQIEQNIIHYAGVLGHYVADGSNPLHTTVHYNGWTTSWNPDLFTREPLHSRFEAEYVRAQIQAADFSGLVKTARQLPDPFHAITKYLLESFSQVQELYRMDKVARWDGNNRNPEAKKFVVARLGAASQMLADLWYSAWLGSANVRPARKFHH
jgi:hypothetical protein